MRENPTVRFAFYDRQPPSIRWRKSKTEWLIVEKGRFGPLWVSKLIFMAAKTFGMIRHERIEKEGGMARTVSINRAAKTPLLQEMRAACIHGFERYGFEHGKIKIICGETEMQELASVVLKGSGIQFDLMGDWTMRQGYDETPYRSPLRIDSVPVHVIPGLKGWAVLPAAV